MIQKGQADALHRKIRMAESGDLDRGNRNLLAETRSACLRKRKPPMDKIIRNFEVSAHHCTQSGWCIAAKWIEAAAKRPFTQPAA
jgi:hypothetical protein